MSEKCLPVQLCVYRVMKVVGLEGKMRSETKILSSVFGLYVPKKIKPQKTKQWKVVNNGEGSDDILFLLTLYLTVSSVFLQAKLLLSEQFEGCCVGRSLVPHALRSPVLSGMQREERDAARNRSGWGQECKI